MEHGFFHLGVSPGSFGWAPFAFGLVPSADWAVTAARHDRRSAAIAVRRLGALGCARLLVDRAREIFLAFFSAALPRLLVLVGLALLLLLPLPLLRLMRLLLSMLLQI